MKKRLSLSLFTIALILTISNGYPGDTGTISGKVIDAITGKGVYKAEVSILDLRLTKRTDAEGKFFFAKVPTGNHELIVQKDHYLHCYFETVTSEANRTTNIDIKLRLQPDFIIVTGTILDAETHTPINGAAIILQGADIGIESDSKGRFTFPIIDAKVYTIRAKADGYKPEWFHDMILSPGPHKNISLTMERIPILESETFIIKHKPVPEILRIVEPLKSEYGRIKRSASNTFIVTDKRNKLNKIKEMVHKYDIPPKQVWLEVRLILASSEKKQSQKMPKELETIAKQLKTLFRYENYEILDDARILAYENKECFSLIGEGKCQMKINRVEYVDVNGGLIKLDRFRLVSGNQDMLTTTVNIPNGDTVILGASNVDGGGKALITAVTAKTLK